MHKKCHIFIKSFQHNNLESFRDFLDMPFKKDFDDGNVNLAFEKRKFAFYRTSYNAF